MSPDPRRPSRRVAAVVAVATALVLLAGACSKKADHPPDDTRVTSTTAQVARPAGYLALGDSYTAGGGAPPYDVVPACAVSAKGYPYVLDTADAEVQLTAVKACGGASTDQMLDDWPARGLPAQIPSTPDPTVGLVTFTIGGNDSNLLSVILACATLDCSDALDSAPATAHLETLASTLKDKVYPALRTAFPKARLVHVGYPLLTSTKLGKVCPWLSSDEETVPNDVVHAVDVAIANAAADSGQVEFVDVAGVFKGHELCTTDPWVNDFKAGAVALHPTAAGYQALGQAIAKYLAR